ncbi:MAG: YciI family protein [Candidatus Eremiobacteraeota bacterium]|nr:YciI family protein [Candidatus Eremiobacteraeota bacterium]
MQFMVLVKASKESESGITATPENKALFEKMGKFNEELARAGMIVAAEGLQPSSEGVRISYSGDKPRVTDGPFAETKELVAGFWLLQAKSMDEVVAWLSRAPFKNGDTVEIRRVSEASDFPPELFSAEDAQRDQSLRRSVQETQNKK